MGANGFLQVLHATKSVEGSLSNIRKLLKPYVPRWITFLRLTDSCSGGKLILFEITQPHIMRAGFAFGLLRDWWAAVEPQATDQLTPCFSANAWDEALRCTGFSGSDITIQQFENVECHEASVICTSALIVPAESPKKLEFAIIILQGSEIQQRYAQELQTGIVQGMGCHCSIMSFQEIASADLSLNPFLVFLVEIGIPFLSTVTVDAYSQLKRVLLSTKSLLWVTQASHSDGQSLFHLVDGLFRSLTSENPQLKTIRLALAMQSGDNLPGSSSVLGVLSQARQCGAEHLEPEYEERDGELCINRVIAAEEMNERLAGLTASHRNANASLSEMPPLELQIGTPGLLETLEYREHSVSPDFLEPEEVFIEVKAFGVHFRDIQAAHGQLNTKTLGTDCSGVIQRTGTSSGFAVGDRVHACGQPMARTHVRCLGLCVQRIPDWMPFTDAATIPTSALGAFHALYNVAKADRDESVLILNGADGFGQIAIQMSKALGARTFIITNSLRSKRLLHELYDVPESQIFSNKDTGYVHAIKDLTSDLGVDIVLHAQSKSGTTIPWDCVAPFGRVIELISEGNAQDKELYQARSANNLTFAQVNLQEIIDQRPSMIVKSFAEVSDMLAKGEVKIPATPRIFQMPETEQALVQFHEEEHLKQRVIELASDCHIPVRTYYELIC